VGRAQDGSEPSFAAAAAAAVVVFRQVDDQPRPRVIRRALGRAQEVLPDAGRAARRRREQQYWQQRHRRHGGGDTMEAAGHVRWTGLRRRRAGIQHASHANGVLGSRCIVVSSVSKTKL